MPGTKETEITHTPYIKILDWRRNENEAWDIAFRCSKTLVNFKQERKYNVMVEWSRRWKKYGIYLVHAD